MLPPGHIAAGYLTAYSLIYATQHGFEPSEVNLLLFIGAFLGAIPDIDFLPFFRKHKSFRIYDDDTHRRYPTHAPLLWLFAGTLVFFMSSNPFYKYLGLLVWLASWSHFVFDSVEFGVRWIWPFNNRYYALFSRSPRETGPPDMSLLYHYLYIIRNYIRKSLTFRIEFAIVFLALFVFISRLFI